MEPRHAMRTTRGLMTSLLAGLEPVLRQLLGLPDHHELGTVLLLGSPVREVTRLARADVERFATVDVFDGPPLSPSTAGPS